MTLPVEFEEIKQRLILISSKLDEPVHVLHFPHQRATDICTAEPCLGFQREALDHLLRAA